jgi:hypothetical protein
MSNEDSKPSAWSLRKKKCEPDCQGEVLPDGGYCNHLEKILRPVTRGMEKDRGLIFTDLIERACSIREEVRERTRRDVMETLVEDFGLEPWERDLFVAKKLDEKPLRQVAKEGGWVNVRSAQYFYQQIIKKLKKRGARL